MATKSSFQTPTSPGHTFNPTVLRADGLGADALLAAVIPLFELDAYATPVIMMAPVPGTLWTLRWKPNTARR